MYLIKSRKKRIEPIHPEKFITFGSYTVRMALKGLSAWKKCDGGSSSFKYLSFPQLAHGSRRLYNAIRFHLMTLIIFVSVHCCCCCCRVPKTKYAFRRIKKQQSLAAVGSKNQNMHSLATEQYVDARAIALNKGKTLNRVAPGTSSLSHNHHQHSGHCLHRLQPQQFCFL